MIGFTKSLAKEGAKYNIHTNVIAPLAATRMTETVMAKDILDLLKVEYIVPLVAYLSHEKCLENGSIFEVGGRWVAKLRWNRSEGQFFINDFTSEKVEEDWDKICSFEKNSSFPEDGNSGMEIMLNLCEKVKAQGNKVASGLQSDEVIGLIRAYLGGDEGKELVKKVGAVFQFDLLEKKGGKSIKSFVIDLKNGNGGLKDGTVDKYDALFTMTDGDFHLVTHGKLNPQMAFIQVSNLIIFLGKNENQR